MIHVSLLGSSKGLLHIAKSFAVTAFHFMGNTLRMVGILQQRREHRDIYVVNLGIPNVKSTKFLKRRDGTTDSTPSLTLMTPK